MIFNCSYRDEQEAESEPVIEQEDRHDQSCSQGHRSSLILQTLEGGAICLLCFANLVSSPTSPTVHVSYALSQLSRAVSGDPPFLRSLLSFHVHLLVSPLVHSLSAFDDDPIASQTTDLIVRLCDSGDSEVFGEFVRRIADRLSSGALAWSRRQVYTLHCFGVLLNYEMKNPYAHIRDKEALLSNLVAGLELPSEEIRGEILFVLYKFSILQFASEDDDSDELLFALCPKVLRLSLEALMKTQSDDLCLNCVALLTVLARKGYFLNAFDIDAIHMDSNEADDYMHEADDGTHRPPLSILFAEAVKGPLLSSDVKVQIGTLDLIFHYLSQEGSTEEQTRMLVEENIADYVFEILRLSECKDPLVNSSLQVLDILSTAEQAFRQRLPIGCAALVPVLHYVAEVPFHPVQCQMLRLFLNCISNCPGMISTPHMEEIAVALTKMLKRHTDGELGMHPETFNNACSIFVALVKSPSSHGNTNLARSVQAASKDAVLSCMSSCSKFPSQFLHSLYLLKEAYAYSCQSHFNSSSNEELRNCISDTCKMHILPLLVMTINDIEEDVVLGILETFQSILTHEFNLQVMEFASILVSSSWFSVAFGCLSFFPTEIMKWRVYLLFSLIVDALHGKDSGQIIRDAAPYMPSDPIDLLFLLGQKNSQNPELSICQSSVFLILELSSYYDVRLADEKLILTSLEQYILVNRDLLFKGANSVPLLRLVNLYGLYRGLIGTCHHIPNSSEAESILFQLMVEHDWDFFSMTFHRTALNWLFEQEKIIQPLSIQILKFCKSSSHSIGILAQGKSSPKLEVRAIAELVAAGNNFGATIFVCLLKQLADEGQEHDIVSVINVIAVIITIVPAASSQLCLHGLSNTIQSLMQLFVHHSLNESLTSVLLFIFNILHSAHPEALYNDEAWPVVVFKLIDYLIHMVAADCWTEEAFLVIGILCLILHHSTNGVLVEAAKSILLNASLASIIRNIVKAGYSKGPALVDQDEGTGTGKTLIYILLLYCFSLRSSDAVLPGVMDWHNAFNQSDVMQLLPLVVVPSNDLCRLMHFGSPLVKLVSSYCLLELFTRISPREDEEHDELNCTMEFLMSVMGVLEGLIFYSDHRVAANCGLCLSIILSWKNLNTHKTRVIGSNNWCRLIVEELAMSLAVPCLASKSFANHHKPGAQIAISLLKLEKVPEWMKSVFDYPCISGIIENLSANNMSTETLLLFRELHNSHYLKGDQIANLSRVLQACRKRIYADGAPTGSVENCMEVTMVQDDSRKVCESLINLMPSKSNTPCGDPRFLEEVEMFLRSLKEADSG